MSVHPLVFEPIYKAKIWGGRRIFDFFNRSRPNDEPIGESWELADLEEDATRVASGPTRGRSLTELVAEWAEGLLGKAELFDGRFPLLIKFLDAQESLSVQVHPTEGVARKLGGNVRVKHEAWYILDAEPDGAIYHGLEPGVTADSFREAMISGRVGGVLRRVPVKAGDCYYLPSGTVHALGAGVLVAEVQTPSDITYRTYDWGRIDSRTGRSRELHLDQAIECIDFDAPTPSIEQTRSHFASVSSTVTDLVRCPSFVIEKVRVAEGVERELPPGEMSVWIVLQGGGEIRWSRHDEPIAFDRGQVVLLPAGLKAATVTFAGSTHWLEVGVPA